MKALFTLYTTLAYLLCLIISFLVIGWPNWTKVEYTALAGSPVLIYLIRTAITTYYNFRVDTVTQRLEGQQAERAKTIEKLKSATKYDSTQELLEKYGAVPPKPKKTSAPKTPKAEKPQSGRTSIGPPLTANISRPGQMQVPTQPSTPQPGNVMRIPQHLIPSPSPATPQAFPHAEFAPNAYSAPPQYVQGTEINTGGNWYDRVLDLLLGEDETLPKNRVALICQSCRLVNGQAPPGTKSLADLGKWRCFGCGTMNGVEHEAVQAVEEMKQLAGSREDENVEAKNDNGKGAEFTSADDSMVEVRKDDSTEGPESVDSAEESSEVETKPKRGRPKGSGKKFVKPTR